MSIFKNLQQYFLSFHHPHGWATQKDIEASSIHLSRVKEAEGVILGIHPATKHLLTDDGEANILLVGPTRSGKSASTIIPTTLSWKGSIFAFDPLGELWAETANYRKKGLHQKIIRFQPLARVNAGAHWNPLSEIRLQTKHELGDAQTVSYLLLGDEEPSIARRKAARSLLTGILLHLLYAARKGHRPVPSISDLCSFFQTKMVKQNIMGMQKGRHISEEDGLQNHLFLDLYGNYITDVTPFREALKAPDIRSTKEILELLKQEARQGTQFQPAFDSLFQHPIVQKSAEAFQEEALKEQDAILQSIQKALDAFCITELQDNMDHSDFQLSNILDDAKNISFYFVMPPIASMRPIARLFLSMLLYASVQREEPKKNQHPHLLLMLDWFPYLGKLPFLEETLAISGKSGIKGCLVLQSLSQLYHVYGVDTSIPRNCDIQIFYTPNTEEGETTRGYISEKLWHQFDEKRKISPESIRKLKEWQEIIFIEGHPPILGKQFRFYENEVFRLRAQQGILA